MKKSAVVRKTFLTVAVLVATSLSLFAQNVGVGTQNPSEKLDVNGNIKVSGAFKPGGSAGTEGQVLTSKGDGQAPQWADPNAWDLDLRGAGLTYSSGNGYGFSSDWYGVRVESGEYKELPYDGTWMVFINSIHDGCNGIMLPLKYSLYYDSSKGKWVVWQKREANVCGTTYTWFGFGAIKVKK